MSDYDRIKGVVVGCYVNAWWHTGRELVLSMRLSLFSIAQVMAVKIGPQRQLHRTSKVSRIAECNVLWSHRQGIPHRRLQDVICSKGLRADLPVEFEKAGSCWWAGIGCHYVAR
ncbi:hypothetical protein KC345_g319 [Hortaea werneckii]|nr:hypothetical protein KC345_g319 [Hortaea werneckii]